MSKIKVLWLALVGVFAVSAVAAVSASATEFKTASFPVTFTGSGGPGELTTKGHKPIKCEASSSSGSVKNNILVEKVVVKYTKCTLVEVVTLSCGNNGSKENITTKEIAAAPVDLGGLNTAPVGLQLKPAAGTLFAEFVCESGFVKEVVKVTGEVLCESKGESVGKLATKGELVCKQKAAGEQEFEKANGGSTIIKLTSEVKGVSEPAAINTTEKLTFSANIEQTTP